MTKRRVQQTQSTEMEFKDKLILVQKGSFPQVVFSMSFMYLTRFSGFHILSSVGIDFEVIPAKSSETVHST